MVRMILVSLVAVLVGAPAAAGPVLENLQETNPAHFEKIEKIRVGLMEQPGRAGTGWLQTNFQAQDVTLSALIKTTDPPKKLLTFTLDDVRYTMHVTYWRQRPPVVRSLTPEERAQLRKELEKPSKPNDAR
jgi:hypothetical protein